MVAPVHLVKTPPLLRRERPQNGMKQNTNPRAESLLSVGQRRVHGHQRVIEAAQRFLSHNRSWCGMFRRLNAWRKLADAQYVYATEPMAESSACGLGLPGFHDTEQSFGCSGVGEYEVLKNLQRVPLAAGCAQPCVGGYAGGCAFSCAPHELELRRHSPHLVMTDNQVPRYRKRPA